MSVIVFHEGGMRVTVRVWCGGKEGVTLGLAGEVGRRDTTLIDCSRERGGSTAG